MTKQIEQGASNSTATETAALGMTYEPCALELELYRSYRPQFDLNRKLSTFDSREKITARQDFWHKVSTLLERLTKIAALFKDKEIKNKKLDNRVEIFQRAIADLQPRKDQYAELNLHLKNTTNYAKELTTALIKQTLSGHSKLATTPRQLQLLAELVTPLHDIIKHLGNWHSQISTDHQVVIQHVLTTFGEFFRLEESEIQFVAQVAGRHENAEDVTRSQLLRSFNERKSTPESNDEELAVIHGQILFYLIDAFTYVIEPEKGNSAKLQLNPRALTERFRDILERWNDPAITPRINPEWALTAYHDFEVALDLLETGNLEIPTEAKLAVIDSAIQSFRYLLVVFDIRKRDNEMVGRRDHTIKPLPIASREQFESVIERLEELAVTEKLKQKTTTINLLSGRLENLMTSLATSQNSVGFHLTKLVQSSYETTTRKQITLEQTEISDEQYEKLAPEYKAFNIIAVSAALNLVNYYLQTPGYQTTLLDFFQQKEGGSSVTVTDIINHPIISQLSQKLAEHLHNQYELSLGKQEHWWRELGQNQTDRTKKERSTIVAMQLLVSIFEYLSQTKLKDTTLLDHRNIQLIKDYNFSNQSSTLEHWLSSSLGQETVITINEAPITAQELVARATHQFWLKAKQHRNDGDMPMNTDKVDHEQLPVKVLAQDDVVLDPALHPFDQLHPQIQKKNLTTAKMALENLVTDLSSEKSLNQPLLKLAQLITYLFDMIKTTDNVATHQTWEQQHSDLVAWADLLTSRQYETWLMHRLAKEGGLQQLNELSSMQYFSLWLEKDETTPYATISGKPNKPDMSLSSRDLDRIPLLMAAITFYLQYYFFMMQNQATYVQPHLHKQNLEKVLHIAELVDFPQMANIYQKLTQL